MSKTERPMDGWMDGLMDGGKMEWIVRRKNKGMGGWYR